MNKVFDIFAGIAAIAMVTTIVAHPYTAGIVTSTGSAYSEALRTAMGTGTKGAK